MCGWLALGVLTVSVVVKFCEAFELYVVRVSERCVHFSGSNCGTGCVIGQVFCASSWYAFSMVMMWSAALSILAGVISGEFVSFAS